MLLEAQALGRILRNLSLSLQKLKIENNNLCMTFSPSREFFELAENCFELYMSPSPTYGFSSELLELSCSYPLWFLS